ncbi:MAG: DUF1361 domain-containing protein [Armatimonadota bacterium]|nr:DUF1361 domain-containing protein [Armatimonadota bacterium]
MMEIIYIFHWVTWNTFLALIPVATGYAISYLAKKQRLFGINLATVSLVFLGVIWFAFLPNTCYLLTEWRHFLNKVGCTGLYAKWTVDHGAALDLMIYTLFYLCYSGIGVLTFTLAVRPIARMLKARRATLWVWGIPFFLLMSVGVYLGLVLRFNSWDLFTRPSKVWESVVSLWSRPAPSFFIIAFAAFLWLIFIAMDIWVDGLIARWKSSLKDSC